MVSGLIFKSLVNFDFIFVNDVKKWSSFILHIAILFSQHHLAIKKNEILLFVATFMDIEGITWSEMSYRQRQILYVESKKQVNKYNKTQTDSKIQRTNWWLSEGRGVGR